jgi:signal peptidase I
LETFQPTGETSTPSGDQPEVLNSPATDAIDGLIIPSAETSAEEKTNWKQFAFDLIETLLLAVVLYFGINAISARVRVDGFSMVPTLQDGEYVLVSKLSYRLGEPQHGDIIVFKYPGEPPQDLIKRIIGLPGDSVQVTGLMVYVNGQALIEPYIAAAPGYSGQWQVPEGFLFVLGDNRNDSSDSHAWGLLPIENVIGKAIIIYWPPPMWKVISHYEIVVAPQ